MSEKQQRAAQEEAAAVALRGAQQPVGELRDLTEEQLTFITSYWSQRPRVSNDEIIASMRRS